MKKAILFILILIFLPILSFNLFSQDDQECLDCHNDPDISMMKNGRSVSLEVKRYELPRSVHADVKCVDCHVGFEPYDIPHKENIEKINCKGCHGSPQ